MRDILAGYRRFDSRCTAGRNFRILADIDIGISGHFFNAYCAGRAKRNDRLAFIAHIRRYKGLGHHGGFLFIVRFSRLIDDIGRQSHCAACCDNLMLFIATGQNDGRIVFHILHSHGSRNSRFCVCIRIKKRIDSIDGRFRDFRIRFYRHIAGGSEFPLRTDIHGRCIFEIADHDGRTDIDIFIPSGRLLLFFFFLFLFRRLFLFRFCITVALHFCLFFFIGLGGSFFFFYCIGIAGGGGHFFVDIFNGSQNPTRCLFGFFITTKERFQSCCRRDLVIVCRSGRLRLDDIFFHRIVISRGVPGCVAGRGTAGRRIPGFHLFIGIIRGDIELRNRILGARFHRSTGQRRIHMDAGIRVRPDEIDRRRKHCYIIRCNLAGNIKRRIRIRCSLQRTACGNIGPFLQIHRRRGLMGDYIHYRIHIRSSCVSIGLLDRRRHFGCIRSIGRNGEISRRLYIA